MSNNEEWIKAHDAHLGAFLAYMETPLPPLRTCSNQKHLHDWASGPECLCDAAQTSQQSQSQPITERIQRHIAEGPAREQLALRSTSGNWQFYVLSDNGGRRWGIVTPILSFGWDYDSFSYDHCRFMFCWGQVVGIRPLRMRYGPRYGSKGYMG